MHPQSTNPTPAKLSDEEFSALFPTMTDQELGALCGRSRAWASDRGRRLGLHKSPEYLAASYKARGEARRGPRAPNWKGGHTGQRDVDYRYRPWRDAILVRDNWTCTRCGDRRRRCEMQVHHIKSWADYPDLRYCPENGATLCEPCHRELHGTTARPRIQIPCRCGCGTLIDAVDKWGYAREWVNGGHATRGRTVTPEQRAAIAKGGEKRRGIKRSDAFKAHLSAVKTGHTLTDAERAGNERRKARWSDKYDCCVACGGSDTKHYGRGLCLRCYCRQRTLRRNPDAPLRPPRHV